MAEQIPPTEKASTDSVVELDYRVADSIEVTLLWDRVNDEVRVAVDDQKTGETFDFPVPRDKAMEGFHHPYAYARAADLGTVALSAEAA